MWRVFLLVCLQCLNRTQGSAHAKQVFYLWAASLALVEVSRESVNLPRSWANFYFGWGTQDFRFIQWVLFSFLLMLCFSYKLLHRDRAVEFFPLFSAVDQCSLGGEKKPGEEGAVWSVGHMVLFEWTHTVTGLWPLHSSSFSFSSLHNLGKPMGGQSGKPVHPPGGIRFWLGLLPLGRGHC